jgi:hypothetical protein
MPAAAANPKCLSRVCCRAASQEAACSCTVLQPQAAPDTQLLFKSGKNHQPGARAAAYRCSTSETGIQSRDAAANTAVQLCSRHAPLKFTTTADCNQHNPTQTSSKRVCVQATVMYLTYASETTSSHHHHATAKLHRQDMHPHQTFETAELPHSQK